jgi:hypothetical protein
MRLIYLCRFFNIPSTGVDKKISAQVEQLANYGLDPIIYSISTGDDRLYADERVKQVQISSTGRGP